MNSSNNSAASASKPMCFETTPAESTDCPICFDSIDPVNNRIVTSCGHLFHASCMFKNAAINGFECPCCRNVLAETPAADDDDEDDDEDEYDDDDDEYEDDESIAEEDNALTSFRMFHQQLDGETVEEEPIEQDEYDEDYDIEDDPSLATVDDVTNHFASLGFTLYDAFVIILNRKRLDVDKDKQLITDTLKTVRQMDATAKRNFYA